MKRFKVDDDRLRLFPVVDLEAAELAFSRLTSCEDLVVFFGEIVDQVIGVAS